MMAHLTLDDLTPGARAIWEGWMARARAERLAREAALLPPVAGADAFKAAGDLETDILGGAVIERDDDALVAAFDKGEQPELPPAGRVTLLNADAAFVGDDVGHSGSPRETPDATA